MQIGGGLTIGGSGFALADNPSTVFAYGVNYLVVAGGGGGGGANGGGGGAGGLLTGSFLAPTSTTTYTIQIGSGGGGGTGPNVQGSNGFSSNILQGATSIVTTVGGGYGGTSNYPTPVPGNPGGSGGGANSGSAAGLSIPARPGE